MSDEDRADRREMEKDSEQANPTSAKNAQVEPTFSKMEIVGINSQEGSKKINLCDTCSLEFATCPKGGKEFGDGIKDDNVVKCANFVK